MAQKGNPYNADAYKNMARKMDDMKPMGGSSWSPWQLLGKVFGNRQEIKPSFENPKDYGTSKLERKNEKIMELEKALEEEKKKNEKNEREKAKLKEDKEKHRIADQKLKDLQLQLENAKNKNKIKNNNNNDRIIGRNGVIEREVWIGKKN